LGALAKRAIGDAYKQNNQKRALDNYLKAVAANNNDFTTPRFLLKQVKQL
jgi:hypothetical protein